MIASFSLLAQDPYYVHINTNKKLPSNNVYDIFQDKAGFMWISHDEGLSRYDGVEFKTYTCPQQTSKPGSDITEDLYGRIWYENFDGYLYYVQNDTMRAFEQPSTTGYQHFGIIGDRLFLRHKDGLGIYDLNTLKCIKTLVVTDKFASTITGKNYIYLIAEKFSKVDYNGKFEHLNVPEDIVKTHGSLAFNGDSVILFDFLGRTNSAYLYFKGKTSPIYSPVFEKVIQSSANNEGNFWFCTPAGAWALDVNFKPLNGGQPYFAGSNISTVVKDREGNYWFSTQGNGIYFVPDIETKVWLSELAIRKMTVYKDQLFLGTNSDEVMQFDKQTNRITPLYNGRSGKEIINLRHDSLEKKLYFTSTHFISITDRGKPISKNILALKDCRRINNKYFAFASTGVSGLFCTDTTGHNKWDHTPGLIAAKNRLFLTAILEGSRGKAVAYFNDANKIIYASNDGLFSQKAGAIPKEIFYKGGKIYISHLQQFGNYVFGLSTGNRLFQVFNSDSIAEIALTDSESEKVQFIKIAGNYLFLMCNNSLFYCNLEKGRTEFKPLNINLSEDRINDIELSGNKLLIAKNKGIVAYDLDHENARSEKPLFVINAVRINNAPRDFKTRLSLSHNENNIEISFSLLCFRSQSGIPLYYKINNRSWEKIASGQPSLKLPALATGDYQITFHAGALTSGNFPEQSIEFEIHEPWWLTWWAISLYCVLGTVVFYVIYRWQTGILKKQNVLLDQKVKLEIALRKTVLKSIKAQMNPHFFYNALNTIQSFIYSEDKKNASAYLGKFSKLTRQILEMSEKDNVLLSEETSALLLYLELEKTRFSGDFDFSIAFAPDLVPEVVQLPPMLIQPYVENAVKHGLLHKKGSKLLLLKFSLQHNSLLVEIDDNGIGRKLSGEINARKAAAHRSFSTGANETRFKMMENEQAVSGVEIIDKLNAEGGPGGTLVKLSIPISLTQK